MDFKKAMDSLSSIADKGGPITDFFAFFYNVHSDELDANEMYRKLYPVLLDIIGREGRNSKNAKNPLEIIANLPQNGARKFYFRKRYIENPAGWKLLPEDPDNFPDTYWHGVLW